MDKLTYEQRVMQVISFLDTELHDDIFSEDAQCIAERFVDSQAEAVRESISELLLIDNDCEMINKHLIDNGYVPSPEVIVKEESAMELLFGEMCTRCKRNVSCCKHKGLSVCLSCCNKLAEED